MTRTRPLPMWRTIVPADAAGGIALIAATMLAMLAANLPPTQGIYAAVLHAPIGPMSVHRWIDDGLMAIFFLLVGLEIKRELVGGQLADPARRLLPFVVAAAGMAVPALVYLAIAGGTPGLARGWAIPAATDIAFAVGVLALLGPRVPVSLKVLLTAVAIVDDMGAVAIIALFYSHGLNLTALAAAAGVLATMAALNRHGERRSWPYLAGFALLWVCMLLSGVHATVAGVLAALIIPAGATAMRLEHRLSPWVAFAIVPLFAFANAGIRLDITPAALLDPLTLGIALGLFLGKQAGIMAAIGLAMWSGLASRPVGAGWAQVYGIALLAGIGFTMSLFIGQLAFPGDAVLAERVRLGVLAGSLLSAVAGYCVLRIAGAKVVRCAVSSIPPS